MSPPRYVSLPLPGYVRRFCADSRQTIVRCPSMRGRGKCLKPARPRRRTRRPAAHFFLDPKRLIAAARRGVPQSTDRRDTCLIVAHLELGASIAAAGWDETDSACLLPINILPSAPPGSPLHPRTRILSISRTPYQAAPFLESPSLSFSRKSEDGSALTHLSTLAIAAVSMIARS